MDYSQKGRNMKKAELRWNPLLREWVAFASHRQKRPHLPESWCPFCPGSGSVPENYDVHIYPNDFPAFLIPPAEIVPHESELYRTKKSEGICDVVLYHPDHGKTLSDLDIDHIIKLIALWQARFRELGKMKEIKYVFIFENKGAVVGVTIHHPHGQIYAFPYIPPKVETELRSCKDYFRQNKKCLLCEIIKQEKKYGRRVIYENDSFLAFIPFFARWPYEVHIYPERHFQTILEFNEEEIKEFARILKIVTQKYDNLFGFSFPYMMIMHQAPTDGKDYPYYHFHMEFYPPHRSADKLKYPASVETAAGTFINDSFPEEKAKEMRKVPPYGDEF
jgi:UDPglucose--hexose-1-phosphate uridylyltransferase